MRGVFTGVLALSLLCLPATVRGQVDTPAPVSNTMPTSGFGFNLPTHLGTLTYALSGSELIQTGSSNGTVYASTALTGDLAYMSTSERNPFSAVYTGGVIFTGVPGSSGTETYQNFAASQVLQTRAWSFVVSDAVSYLPGSPTTGLSGVAGVGDVGVVPVQNGLGPTENILTNYSSRLTNGLEGSASWQATPSLSLQGSGNWQILHFVNGEPGYDTNEYGATVGPNFRIDARNSVGAEAYYSRQTYPGYQNYLIETEGVNATFNRAWTRKLSTTVSFGPSRTHGTTYTTIPSQWNPSGTVEVSYATRTTGLYANYARAVNGGSGIVFGAISDSVSTGLNRPINRDWTVGLEITYSHDVALAPINNLKPTYDSVYGAAQVARRLTESLSCFASYTAISQSAKNEPANFSTAFNGLNHIISLGITFAPAPLIRGR